MQLETSLCRGGSETRPCEVVVHPQALENRPKRVQSPTPRGLVPFTRPEQCP
jgi:hypothetical protein